MLRVILVVTSLAISACSLAEDKDPVHRTIAVSGTGSAPATPDRARLSMSVVSRDKSLDNAQGNAAAIADKVLAITDKLGMDRSRIDTTGASVRADYRYDRDSGEQRFNGYIAERRISVEFRDLENLAPVIEGAVAAGVQQVSPPTLFSSKQRDVYREALDNAAADARANATTLVEALGAKLGQVVTIDAGGYSNPMPNARAGYANAMAMDTEAAATYNAGDQTVWANVTVVFEVVD